MPRTILRAPEDTELQERILTALTESPGQSSRELAGRLKTTVGDIIIQVGWLIDANAIERDVDTGGHFRIV